jgi:NitT/TauT family transport system substrate-binding protein
MQDAFADPEEAGRIMNKYHPTVDVLVAKGETEAVAELAHVKGEPLGMINPYRIDETIKAVTSVFTLKKPVGARDMYEPGFVPR